MSDQPATGTLGSTTVVFGWVEENQVQQMLHASDGFQLMLGISLAGFGGLAAGLVALAAGALHPIALYLILCVLGTATLLVGGFAKREYARYRAVRSQLTAATARVPVPVLLVTPGQPSFTVGGQAVGGSAQLVPGLQPVQPSDTPDPDTSATAEDQPVSAVDNESVGGQET